MVDTSGQSIIERLVDKIGGNNTQKFYRPNRPKPRTTLYEPATPEPRYICENCGMLIETGHKHTRPECQEYKENPLTPDTGAHRNILPGRNDPKVRLPYYYDSSSTTKREE